MPRESLGLVRTEDCQGKLSVPQRTEAPNHSMLSAPLRRGYLKTTPSATQCRGTLKALGLPWPRLPNALALGSLEPRPCQTKQTQGSRPSLSEAKTYLKLSAPSESKLPHA